MTSTNNRRKLRAPSTIQSLRKDYQAGRISAQEAAAELHRAGLCNYVPEEKAALHRLGISQ